MKTLADFEPGTAVVCKYLWETNYKHGTIIESDCNKVCIKLDNGQTRIKNFKEDDGLTLIKRINQNAKA